MTAQARPGLPPRQARGFSLVELLAVLAILSVFAMQAIPLAQLHAQRQREHELRLALREVRAAIDAYKRASDEGRIRRALGSSGYPPDLQTLVEGVEDPHDPQRRKLYFLRRIPRDPFHPDPTADPASTWALRAYASEADDFAEGEDIYDLRSRSDAVGLNRVPLRLW